MGHQANVKWARRHLHRQIDRAHAPSFFAGLAHEQVKKRLVKLETDARRTAAWLGLRLPPRMHGVR